jgi:hypothetical protein
VYISSPFSNQGLPEVKEFLFIHPKPQCLHIVYTIITVNKAYINTLGVPHCHIAMGIFVHFSLNWTPWHLVPWPLEHNCPNQSDSQIVNINITTIGIIYMLLDVIWSCVRFMQSLGERLGVLNSEKVSFHLLHIKKLIIVEAMNFLRFYHG